MWADLLTRWAAPTPVPWPMAHPQSREDATADSVAQFRAFALTTGPGVVQPMRDVDFVWPTIPDIVQAQERALQTSHKSGQERTVCVNRMVFEQDPVTKLWKTTDGGIVWIPEAEFLLRVRLCVIAHSGAAGHRGVNPTLRALKLRFYWKDMDKDVQEFIRNCLHCTVNKGGVLVPRPLGNTLEALRPNHVHLADWIKIRDPTPEHPFGYLLVEVDKYSKMFEATAAESPNATNTARALLDWSSRYGSPEILVTDQGTHFVNEVIAEMCHLMDTKQQFTTAYCPWANGTVERVNRTVLSVLRALCSEFRLPFERFHELLPVLRSVLNNALDASGDAAISKMLNLPAQSPLDVVYAPELSKKVKRSHMTEAKVQKLVEPALIAVNEMHTNITEEQTQVPKERRPRRKKKPELPNFGVGDYVLVSTTLNRSLPTSRAPHKLSVRWNGPRRITAVESDFVFEVEDLITGKKEMVHCVRLRFYADDKLNVTEELLAQIAHDDAGYEIESFGEARKNPKTKQWELSVHWRGFEASADTWEPIFQLYKDVPVFLKRELRKKAKTGDEDAAKILKVLEDSDQTRKRGRRK